MCSKQAYICTKVFEDPCWILIKVSPSLGSSPLMVKELDPRVADTSRAEGVLDPSWGVSGRQHNFFVCLFWMPAKHSVGCPVLFPSQIPELSGQMALSLRSGTSWKEVFSGVGDSVLLACVLGGEEGSTA